MASCKVSHLVWMALMGLIPCSQGQVFSRIDDIGYICNVNSTFGVVPVCSLRQCALLCLQSAQDKCITLQVFTDISCMKCALCTEGCNKDNVIVNNGRIYSLSPESLRENTETPQGIFVLILTPLPATLLHIRVDIFLVVLRVLGKIFTLHILSRAWLTH